MYRCCLIWLWKQNIKDHLPAFQQTWEVDIVWWYDISEDAFERIKDTWIKTFQDLDEMLNLKPDFVSIAIPHGSYYEIIQKCAEKWIHIFKEKPYWISLEETQKIEKLLKKNDVKMQVCAQKRFTHTYEFLTGLLSRIWNVYSIFVQNTLALESVKSRRADIKQAWWWSVLDLWYHYLDLLVGLFWLPKSVYSTLIYENDIDVHMKSQMKYVKRNWDKILCNAMISLTYYKKSDRFQIYGSDWVIKVEGNSISLCDKQNNIIEEHNYLNNNIDCLNKQAKLFLDLIKFNKENDLDTHLDTMKLIDAIYKSSDKDEVITLNPVL